jgi:hypothetical protein
LAAEEIKPVKDATAVRAVALSTTSEKYDCSTVIISEAARAPQVSALDPVVVFAARCSARAMLVANTHMLLAEAVDQLQADAERTGLVDLIGQDRVQHIMSLAFHEVSR